MYAPGATGLGPFPSDPNHLRTRLYPNNNCVAAPSSDVVYPYRRGFSFLCDKDYSVNLPAGPLSISQFSAALKTACQLNDHSSYGVCGMNPPTAQKGGITSPIVTAPAQSESCPQEGNPCSPGTGNKTASETDIDLPTLTFARYYNSLRQVRTTAMIDRNWSHSYSARIMMNTSAQTMTCVSCNSDSVWMVTDKGLLEKYSKIGGTNRFRSENNLGDQLECNGSSFTAIAGDGRRRYFDGRGFLVAEVDPSQPERSVQITWSSAFDDNIPRITTIQSGNGRSLTLQYGDGPFASGYPSELGFSTNYGVVLTSVKLGATTLASYSYSKQSLASVTYADGNKRSYSYGTVPWVPDRPNKFSYHLTGISDLALQPNGSLVLHPFANYGYDERGRASKSVHDGGNGAVELTYQTDGRVKVLQPGGLARNVYEFAGSSDVGAFRKPSRLTVELLDTAGNVTSSYVKTEWTYYTNGRLKSKTDYRSKLDSSITKYFYDGDTVGVDNNTGRRETRRIEAFGSSVQRTIDQTWDYAINKMTSRVIKGPTGIVESKVAYAYNSDGDLVASCAYGDATSNYQCTDSGTAPTTVRRTVYTYCAAAGAGTNCGLLGQLKSIDGPRTDVNDVTTYDYYETDDATGNYRRGDRKSVTNAVGHVTEYTRYDAQGRAIEWIDANQVGHMASYNARGWKLSETVLGPNPGSTADDAITLYTYNYQGNVATMTRPDATYVTFEYDNDRRITNVIDSDATRIHYTYDVWGNRTREEIKDATGTVLKLSTKTYDELGRLDLVRDAAGNTVFDYQYDQQGNQQQEDARTGPGAAQLQSTQYVYDALSRLREVHDAQVPSGITTYERDALNRTRLVTDAEGVPTSYDYNVLGDQTQLNSRDAGISVFTSDIAGNRSTGTDARGIQSIRGYDALGRIVTVTYPTASDENLSFNYDAAPPSCPAQPDNFPVGRLTMFTDDTGYTCLYYDRLGNTTRKYQVTQGSSYNIVMSYTLANRLATLAYPNGLVLTYGRDPLGRISSITANGAGLPGNTAVVNNVTYWPFSGPRALTFGNTSTLTHNRDSDYRIAQVQSNALNLTFGFDWQGNIIDAGPAGSRTRLQFSYDSMYRLQQVDLVGNQYAGYTYDRIGNRLSALDSKGSVRSYSYDYSTQGHRLKHIAGNDKDRSYDANGNTTSMVLPISEKDVYLSYNARNRLERVSQAQPQEPNKAIQWVVNHGYNAIGERVHRDNVELDDPSRHFVYFGGPTLLYERDPSEASDTAYIYVENMPVALVRGGALFYIHTDHLDTPRAIVDTSGTVQWKWGFAASNGESNAFGEAPPETSSFEFNMRFPGQYHDSSTGLSYNYFRNYESATGRYVESDPIGLRGGIATFSYATQSPLRFADKRGLEVQIEPLPDLPTPDPGERLPWEPNRPTNISCPLPPPGYYYNGNDVFVDNIDKCFFIGFVGTQFVGLCVGAGGPGDGQYGERCSVKCKYRGMFECQEATDLVLPGVCEMQPFPPISI